MHKCLSSSSLYFILVSVYDVLSSMYSTVLPIGSSMTQFWSKLLYLSILNHLQQFCNSLSLQISWVHTVITNFRTLCKLWYILPIGSWVTQTQLFLLEKRLLNWNCDVLLQFEPLQNMFILEFRDCANFTIS